MSSRRGGLRTTRKHLARAERERLQRRWILAGTLVILLLVVGLLTFGWLQTRWLLPNQPVAIVAGEEISVQQFQSRVRLTRLALLSQLANAEQMRTIFGGDPSVSDMIDRQVASYRQQLANPTALGLDTLEDMIDEALIRQEANRRGIMVTAEELERAVQEEFGFFAFGTPTPAPTSTASSEAASPGITPTSSASPTEAATATATTPPTPGPSPTVTPTPAPLPTSTPYTRDAFEADYQGRIEFIERFGSDEAALRSQIEARLYRERLRAAFAETVPAEQEQVWARHILVADEETAREVLRRLNEGEDWDALAAEVSLDQSNRDAGGDLGWFPLGLGIMVPEFEAGVSSTPMGETSEPVQTSFGWHLIEVLDRGLRPLTVAQQEQAVEAALRQWLSDQRAEGVVEVKPSWIDQVPTDPDESSLTASP
jgi:peptidyl-prolyl cis-trans isomerase D